MSAKGESAECRSSTPARDEDVGALPAGAPRGEGNSAATQFGHFAERVLPTLKQLRAARKVAETLADGTPLPALERIVRQALASIRSIDATLRTTGVYDLSELAMLEADAARMSAVCRVLDEVGERLRGLARDLRQQAASLGDAETAGRLLALAALLEAPLRGAPAVSPTAPDAA